MRTLYSFAELARMTNLEPKLVNRIHELLRTGKIILKSAKGNQTFIACTGSMVFSYTAVLFLNTGRAYYTIDDKRRPTDVLAKVAELLAKDAKMYGKF